MLNFLELLSALEPRKAPRAAECPRWRHHPQGSGDSDHGAKRRNKVIRE